MANQQSGSGDKSNSGNAGNTGNASNRNQNQGSAFSNRDLDEDNLNDRGMRAQQKSGSQGGSQQAQQGKSGSSEKKGGMK